ncbi:MAG: substrate-binding domain-containing protein [Balneola sp.]
MKTHKILSIKFTLLLAIAFISCSDISDNKVSQNRDSNQPKYSSELLDRSIKYQPKDDTIRIYGAGGPQTAIKRVATIYEKDTGNQVEVYFGPESKWTKDAQARADILWGTAEQSMTAFLQTYTEFESEDVEPIYIRPAAIAVQKGNPKNIQGIEDLLKPNMKIVVVEGSGVYNTSGTGVWEDVVGRKGNLEDLKKFRANIIDFALGSGAGFRAFKDKKADAWITWNYWVITHPDQADLIQIESDRRIYRDLTVVTNDKADSQAHDFINFLKSDKAIEIFKSEGWSR